MKTHETTSSASNRLYRGEVAGFVNAMECVAAAVNDELRICARYAREFPGEQHEAPEEELRAYKATAAQCMNEYLERVHAAALTLAAEWQRSGDADVRRIGEALASGDYSELAI